MVLLPAIFFKLGVAFTLLVLVTVVSINNGFIGFLLLVVGLSNVLARLQEARKPAPLPYLPQYYHLLDRSDSLDRASDVNKEQKSGYNQQLYYYGQKRTLCD
ncbi:hypothetical protein ABEB36_012541 [Hypothenemus hampei]|uniref:Uncharacterized protein n=1 Tax=Hypothenemus hampei TaxID=57062 RepID=A0ABD1EBL0_HYPHA